MGVSVLGGTSSPASTVTANSVRGVRAFGDGSDGAVTIAANTTLTRDMFYTTLTVNSGFILNTGGFRIFASVSVTNNGTIANNGTNANSTNPGTGGAAGTMAGGGNGGNQAGSAGGTVSGTLSGGGGSAGGVIPLDSNTLSTATIAGGAGGSGSGSISNSGGAGGGGGGAILIASPSITNNGVIQAIGGNGGYFNGYGGGSGGGGVVVFICNTRTGTKADVSSGPGPAGKAAEVFLS